MDSNYKQFKKDIKSMKLFDFMDKWEKHPKYEEYGQKKYDEDLYEYVCASYNNDKNKIEKWMIFNHTCELYVKCLNKN